VKHILPIILYILKHYGKRENTWIEGDCTIACYPLLVSKRHIHTNDFLKEGAVLFLMQANT
jgi:hypothetical protein